MSRRNQRDVILDVLQRARGEEVALPAILLKNFPVWSTNQRTARRGIHHRNRVEHRTGSVFVGIAWNLRR